MRAFSRADERAGFRIPNADFGIFGPRGDAVSFGAPRYGATWKIVAHEGELCRPCFCVDDAHASIRSRGSKKSACAGRGSEGECFLAEHGAGGGESVIGLTDRNGRNECCENHNNWGSPPGKSQRAPSWRFMIGRLRAAYVSLG